MKVNEDSEHLPARPREAQLEGLLEEAIVALENFTGMTYREREAIIDKLRKGASR